MRFNFHRFFQSKLCIDIAIIALVYFAVELWYSADIKKKNPYIKGVKIVNDPTSSYGNNSFVYSSSDNIIYSRINNQYFGIETKGAVLSPHYKMCVKNDDFMDFSINVYNDQPPRKWIYQRKKTVRETTYRNATIGNFTVSKELFMFQGSNRDYTPTKSDLERFEYSDAAKDGFEYIGDGWFYLAEGYDVKKAFRAYSSMQTTFSTSSSFFYVGNPFVTLIINILTTLFKRYTTRRENSKNTAYNRLFESCKEGDLRVRFRVFDSNEASVIGFRNNSIITLGKNKGETYGRIVDGIKSPTKVMRPTKFLHGDISLFRLIVFVLIIVMISKVSLTPKELNMNLLLAAVVVYFIRSLIWNYGYLKPAYAVSFLIFYLTVYVSA